MTGSPAWSVRRAVAIATTLVLSATVLSATALTAQTRLNVSGIVTGNDGTPIGNALVLIDSTNALRGMRTDASGSFRFAGVPSGPHELQVLSIGYTSVRRLIMVADADFSVAIVMTRQAARMDTVVVSGRRTGLFGTVSQLPGLVPVSGAKIEVVGARITTFTDTAGKFNLPKLKPGNYLVRVDRDGLREHRRALIIEKNVAYEYNPVLVPASDEERNEDALWAEADARAHSGGINAAFIPREELGPNPRGDLSLYLARAHTTLVKNLQDALGSSCVFIDGHPASGVPLQSFSVGEVEAVEIYASGTMQAHELAMLWPLGASCGTGMYNSGPASTELFSARPGVEAPSSWAPKTYEQQYRSSFIVIWLRH